MRTILLCVLLLCPLILQAQIFPPANAKKLNVTATWSILQLDAGEIRGGYIYPEWTDATDTLIICQVGASSSAIQTDTTTTHREYMTNGDVWNVPAGSKTPKIYIRSDDGTTLALRYRIW